MKQFILLSLFSTTLLTSFAQSPATELPEAFPATWVAPAASEDDAPIQWFTGEIDPNIQSITSGNWNSPDTWDCACIPSGTDAVRISDGHTVTLTETTIVQDLLIEADGSLYCSPATPVVLKLSGDLECMGSMDAGDHTLTFANGADHMVTGTVTAGTVRVLGGSLTIGGSLRVEQTVELSNAILYSDGHLSLDWNGSQMASISDLTGSSVVGAVRMTNRYAASVDDWIAISSVGSNMTAEPWNDVFVTYGFPEANYPSYGGFQSIMYYDETQADEATSFVGISSELDVLTPGRGYYLYTTAGDFTVNSQFEISQGDVDFEVSYTDFDDATHDGYNLLGNPYPSTIDWDEAAGWTRQNIDGALYLWNPETRQYKTYVNGLSLNGGSPLIPAGCAFIARATNSACELTVHESAKTNSSSTTTNQGDVIHLVISDDQGNYDELVVVENAEASEGFDPQLDAHKLMSDTYHNFYLKSPDGNKLGINQRDLEAGTTVDIYFSTPTPGTYTLNMAGAPQTGPDWCMALEDILTGEMHELVAGTGFEFSSNEVSDQLRFRIHVGQPIDVDVTPITCAGDGDATIQVTGNGNGDFTYSWYTGETLTQIVHVTDQPSTLEGVNPGTYTIVVDGNELCDGLTTTVEVQDQLPIEIAQVYIETPECGENNTGHIQIEAQGGYGMLEYQWTNGYQSPSMSNLMPGFYHVTVTDFNGCTLQETFEIEDKIEVEANFELAEAVIELQDGQAFVDITNLTTGADTWMWNMGDETYYTDEVPTHFYTAPGVYDIDLEASNEDCFGMTSVSVIVNESSVGVNDIEAGDLANCWMNSDQVHVVFDLPTTEQVSIRVYNEVGQLIVSTGPTNLQFEHLTLDVPSTLNWAVVDVRYLTSGKSERFKVAE